jgi:peptide chain release factor 2
MQIDFRHIDFEQLKARITTLQRDMGYSNIRQKRDKLRSRHQAPDFWAEPDQASQIVAELKALERRIQPIDKIIQCVNSLEEEFESFSAFSADDDPATLAALVQDYTKRYGLVIEEVQTAAVQALLNGEFDDNNAILTIRAESNHPAPCAFAVNLCKMYQKWAISRGFSSELIGSQKASWNEGEAIESATLRVVGKYAYGLLQSESGVHRLNGLHDRTSRFSANARVVAISELAKSNQRSGTGLGHNVRTYSEKTGIVIDNLTGVKGDLTSVMNGEIGPFIRARLGQGATAANSEAQAPRRGKLKC